MSRFTRRLVRRIKFFSLGVVLSAAIYHRWQYRRSAVIPLEQCSNGNDNTVQEQQAKALSLFNLRSSTTIDNPFDVLVVGGNLIALYTAVDAAQRGLRVALVTDHDFTPEMSAETVLPGAFPFMQQAIRQRDWHIFCKGLEALAAFTTWFNVAPFCCVRQADSLLSTSHNNDNSNNSKNMESGGGVGEKHQQQYEKEMEHKLPEPQWPQRWQLFRSCSAVRTYVPAMSWFEFTEFVCAALLYTAISPLYGSWRPCKVVRPGKAQKFIKMKEDLAQGGVIVHDGAFDANTATFALLRTAEALGVTLLNYTSVQSFMYCNTHKVESSHNSSETEHEDVSTSIIVAKLQAQSTSTHFDNEMTAVASHINGNRKHSVNFWNRSYSSACTLPIYTRGVINCAGNDADRIKALVPNNEKETTPFAYDEYMAFSYLVAPHSAIHLASQQQASFQEAHVAQSKHSARWIDKIDAFMISSTRFILRPMCMILPWYDHCVLIGPYTHLIQSSAKSTEQTKLNAATTHKYDKEVNEITTMCKYAGIEIDKTQILSCVTSFMPVLRRAEAIPWLKEVVQKGYHIDISSKPNTVDNDVYSSKDNTKSSNAVVVTENVNRVMNTKASTTVDKLNSQPFIHLYGGTALFARNIAEELVNTYLDHTCALTDTQRALCKPCATRYLGLLPPSQKLVDMNHKSSSEELREQAQVGDTYTTSTHICHLSDLVLRRWHIGYTSPAEAVRALPILAQMLQSKLGWDAQRTTKEIDDAYNAIMASAVTHKNVARP